MNVVNSVRTSPNVRVFNRAMAICFGTSPDARSINWHCHKCRCDVGSCRIAIAYGVGSQHMLMPQAVR